MGSKSPGNSSQPPAFFSKLTESNSAMVKSKKQEINKKLNTHNRNEPEYSKRQAQPLGSRACAAGASAVREAHRVALASPPPGPLLPLPRAPDGLWLCRSCWPVEAAPRTAPSTQQALGEYLDGWVCAEPRTGSQGLGSSPPTSPVCPPFIPLIVVFGIFFYPFTWLLEVNPNVAPPLSTVRVRDSVSTPAALCTQTSSHVVHIAQTRRGMVRGWVTS